MAEGFQSLRVTAPGIQAVMAESAHRFARHCHDQFGIGLILRGAQSSASGRGEVEAGAGSLITVNPGEVHDGRPIAGQPRAWAMLYFDPAVVAPAFGSLSDGRHASGELAHPVSGDRAAIAAFRALHAALLAGEAVAADEALLRLVAPLAEPGRVARPEADPRGLARARAAIDDDPAADLSLAGLAELAGMGRFQLLRGFAAAYGLTPHAYRIQRRLHLARRRVLAGETLASAALDAGFADQSHMTRAFVQSHGLTPGRLRG